MAKKSQPTERQVSAWLYLVVGPLINGLGFSGVAAIAVGIKIQKPTARLAWWLFVLGQLLFFSGDLYTYSYPNVSFPSVGDALYLAVYPVLMAGLFVLVKRRNPRRDLTSLIDALILTIGVGLFSWAYVIAPNIHLSGSFLVKSVSIAYPAGDVLLLAAAIRLAVDMGKRAPAFYLLVGSIVCLLTTDSAYNIALLKGTYDHSQLIYDLGWILYYLLWGAAALHPSMRVLEEPSEARARLTRSRLAVLGLACLISPAIRFAQAIHNPDVLVLCHGGPISEPEDARYILEHTRGVAGFFGASSIERLPTEVAITGCVKQFKGIVLGEPGA